MPGLYDLVFPRWTPRPALRPLARAAGDAVFRVTWLGTASHLVETAGATVWIDPFVTRPRLSAALAPLVPDDAAIARVQPARLDAVLCGHSHFDHILDAPHAALRSGARYVGSASACAFARATGVAAERIDEVGPSGRTLTIGDMTITFVPSLHGKIFFHRVPLPGDVRGTPRLPAHVWDYKMGGAFGILIESRGVTLYHNGSANLIDAQLDGRRADVLLVGLAGRRDTPAYLARLTDLLRPKLIVPTHHDAFFAPLERGLHLLPNIDLDGFVREAQQRAPAARVVTPDYHEVLAVPAGAGDAALLAA